MNSTIKALIGCGIASVQAEKLKGEGYTLSRLQQMTADLLEELGLNHEQIKCLHDKERPKLPEEILTNILYKSAFTCCICKDKKKGVIVHHIEPFSESRNHSEDNLVVLCPDHHDQAHTRRELSLNLTKDNLRLFKKKWEDEVIQITRESIHLEKQLLQPFQSPLWSYLNIDKMINLSNKLKIDCRDTQYFNNLLEQGWVNQEGMVEESKIFANRENPKLYIYDLYLPWNQLLYGHHCEIFAKIINQIDIKDVTNVQSKLDIDNLLQYGDIFIRQSAFYFQSIEEPQMKGWKKGYKKKGNIEIEFSFNTRYVTCQSALSVHLCGHTFQTLVGIVRNKVRENGVLKITATPLAIGTEFNNWSESPTFIKAQSFEMGWGE